MCALQAWWRTADAIEEEAWPIGPGTPAFTKEGHPIALPPIWLRRAADRVVDSKSEAAVTVLQQGVVHSVSGGQPRCA